MESNTSNQNLFVSLDIAGVFEIEELLEKFDEKFGFVEWWGHNFNALADCLFTIYFPDQNLCNLTNYFDSETIIECKIKTGQEKIVIYIVNLLSYVNEKLITHTSGRFSFRPIW